ncbi:MAG: FMN-binding protein, partial [Lachnospiraceae bacterium]|nr:FMN-binding protein [Lachnospiraceae bacterium]
MRRRKLLCKMTAVLLSAAMAVTCTTISGRTKIHAAEIAGAQNGFTFGTAQTELSAGEYSLPVALKNASDTTKDSMAGSCVKEGTLTVNQDGTADITVGLQAVSVQGVTVWAEQWKIYTKADSSEEDKKEAEYTTNEEGNVDRITFRLPANTMDGVYTDMYVSAMNTTMSAYFAFDYASAAVIGSGSTAEKKNGSAKVQQFGGYDVNVAVSVLEGKISDLEVEGANFEGTYADYNKTKLAAAADGLKISYVGKSATDAKEIEGVDAVSGATYSSEAIQSAVLHALELEATGEVITLPAEKLAEGIYQVDIAFYTAGTKHSLVENDKAKATITVDAEGNMTLTTAVVNGTEKEPLYFYEFNGYYEGNDVEGDLKAANNVKKEDIDFTDDVFGPEEKVVTEVSFPLEGEFAETYLANASIYVPAMNKLTGEMGGIVFDQGRFSSDCFAEIYWNSLEKVGDIGKEPGFGSLGKELAEGTYTLPVGMKNATDITKESMAASCLQGAAITVNPDGSAKVVVDLTAVSVMEQTAWAYDWKIFTEQNTSSDTVDAEVTKTDADGNVTQISFTLPNNRVDGVYVSMSAMGGRVMQAYLAFDFANVVK